MMERALKQDTVERTGIFCYQLAPMTLRPLLFVLGFLRPDRNPLSRLSYFCKLFRGVVNIHLVFSSAIGLTKPR